jgi:hypothetical protein
MEAIENINKPTKLEQKAAIKSYAALAVALTHIKEEQTEIEIEETRDKIIIPSRALKLLGDILKAMSEGKPISIVPIATEVTTQKAAEIIGCSRPHLVKVGKHRRILFEDVTKYKQKMKEEQKKHIIDMMNQDEELGLYDS